MTNCEYAHDDGAYVLGAMSPAERAGYERHLAGCPSCREAVAEIAVLPGLLGRLDPAGLERIAEPSGPGERLPKLLDEARARQRRERRRGRLRTGVLALVAAALAAVLGFGVAVPVVGGGDSGTGVEVRMVAMQPVHGNVPVSAEIGFDGTRWGTLVTMRCQYAKTRDYTKAYTFRLVAHGPNGETEQIGSWLAAPGDDATFTGVTRFTRSELIRLELLRYDNTPLLAYDVP
ncbi:zf-HC2 domain-containing protein [Micromonospora sp. WMMD1102]|uniref:anti-sigma factor family protein n=1 Tax=Micromonospora sp. WMMD1102 TaxID=3016105 RepID=UPI0024154AFE|nr:zf-HC2 domain-containing protein [Micromonospora sp. WMMD1102]MDG4790518.1 zf-HC2 domain-containing protein [Micromonospora sp. WMMD1102]